MSESRGADAAVRLQANAEEMLAEVDRLPAGLASWVPAPGVWTVMEILCHVEEFVPYWTAQTLRITQQPREQWGRDHTNRDRLTAVERAPARQLSDVQAGIRRAVKESAETLARLSDADLEIEATSRNPRWGQKPAHFVVEHLLVQHVEKHIGQIRRNVTQYQQRDENTV